MSGRVLVVGGLGFFGRRLVTELLRDTDARVTVGGRRRADFEVFRAACAGGERLSLPGMAWANVALVPCIAAWQLGVGLAARSRARAAG